MMVLDLRRLFIRRPSAVWLVAVFVAACGGGVDSGGTGAPATAFASGPVTGFGSVIVNGIHFDDRSALVSDADGNLRSRDDLRLGMTVEARGTGVIPDADGNDSSTATSIVFISEIVGPISSSDVSAHTLVVLGQTVDITSTTVFDNVLAGGQGALSVGDVAEVYASFDAATGRYTATRIERKTSVSNFALRGVVSNLDTTARLFSLGAARISYASLGTAGVPAALANGQFVRVSLNLVPGAGGVWVAVRINDGKPATVDHDDAKIRGLVSAFTSLAQFSIEGAPVDARNAQFPEGSAQIALGQRVEVRGSTVAGVLVATRVDVISDSDESGREFETRGTVASLNLAAKTFVVRGVTVSYAGTVDFRDGTAANLAVGLDVDARGRLSADGTLLQATRIDFRN